MSHYDIYNNDGNSPNEIYDNYKRDGDMPLEGHAGAMIYLSNQFKNDTHTTLTEDHTNMIDRRIYITNTQITLV